MTPDPTVIDVDPIAEPPGEYVEEILPESFEPADEPPGGDTGSIAGLIFFIVAVLAIGFLQTWWIPAILAGLLFTLFMHELGHYVTARMSGMKVTEFFLGFGPRIWSFRKGETEYGIKAIPAGAYVRIIGMTNLDEIDPAEEHRTYRAQPYWQRMMTICAGSAMHFLMATIALFIMFLSQGYAGFNGPPWVVSQVVEGSTASSLGIEVGDSVRSVNGDTFANWDEFGELISNLEEGPVEIVIERDGERLELQGDLGLRPQDVLYDGFGLRMLPEDPASGNWEVALLWPTDPAERFGLEQGDEILQAGGVEQPTENTMAAMLRERNGEDITIDVLRDGAQLTLSGAVELNTSTPFRGFFGVGPEFVPEGNLGFAESATNAVSDFGVIAKANLASLFDMINPVRWLSDGEADVPRRAAEVRQAVEIQLRQEQQAQLEAEGIAPPEPSDGCDTSDADTNRPLSVIGIGRLIACSESADQIIFLFAVVNIFIGIFNLLPVLPVDGGHAAVATYERIRGLVTRTDHRVDASKLIPITWVVILLLVGVGVWTTTLDIFSWPG